MLEPGTLTATRNCKDMIYLDGKACPGCEAWRTKKRPTFIVDLFFVGVKRLELSTLWSQTRCASQLRHTPRAVQS